MKDEFKRQSNKKIGIGGYHCSCCGPAPGKERKMLRRTSRHMLKDTDRKRFNEFTIRTQEAA